MGDKGIPGSVPVPGRLTGKPLPFPAFHDGLPKEGEQVEFQGLRFTAVEVQGRRIASVLIARLPQPVAADADEEGSA